MSTKTISFPIEELKKLPKEVLSGLLTIELSDTTKRRVEILLRGREVSTDMELMKIDFDEREKRIFSEIAGRRSRYPMLDPEFVTKYRRELVVTARSIGAYAEMLQESPSEEQDRNYRFWMGGKLNLSKEEIESFSLETIERRFAEKLDLARKHVSDRIGMLSPEVRDLFRSEYFDDLHSTGELGLSPRRLFALFIEFERIAESYLHSETHPNAVSEIRKAQYEIQCIFGLADLYRDYEQTPEYQNLTFDSAFLERKVSSLFESSAAEKAPVPLPSLRHVKPKNILYAHTLSKKIYWKKRIDGSYEISSNSLTDAAGSAKLESATFIGKRRNALRSAVRIPVLHVEIRSMKDPASAVDKYLRKGLSSFGEILDQKGMIIVLDSLDGMKPRILQALLENELWTGSSSWKEPLVPIGEGNAHTKDGYHCYKGVMKVPHKLKPMKDSLRNMEGVFNELDATIRTIGRKRAEFRPIVQQAKDEFAQFSERFRDSSYNVDLEVQIFDLEGYLKAEKDPDSPANHDAYKRSQILREVLPILRPASIYGKEALWTALAEEVRTMVREEISR